MRSNGWMTAVLAMALLGWVAACGDEHGHDHGPDGHDHDHDHVHEAKFGGELIPVGEEFANVELKLDAETGAAEAWIWDGCVEKPIRIAQETLDFDVKHGDETITLTLEAQAASLTGETVGDSSRFSGSNDQLKGLTGVTGTLRSIEIKGQKASDIAFDFGEG